MRAPLPVLALLALVAVALAAPGLGAPPGPPVTRTFTWEVTAVPCSGMPDGICLAYDGQVPGPTLDVNLGDTVVITLVQRVNDTLPAGTPPALRERLAAAAVSFHVHGTSISAAEDGVAAHAGTQLVESVARPDEPFTYTFRAVYAGTWHYHDHVLGLDGAEGTQRGLFGSLIVRNGAEPRPDHVLDVHAHDNGLNAGLGIRAPTVQAGHDLDVAVVGLGNFVWTVKLQGPDGALLDQAEVGPGVSERMHVADALPGTYRWTATWGPYAHVAEVTVQ